MGKFNFFMKAIANFSMDKERTIMSSLCASCVGSDRLPFFADVLVGSDLDSAILTDCAVLVLIPTDSCLLSNSLLFPSE